jgi:CubicO group peptidase (beta-lactamase class C family)
MNKKISFYIIAGCMLAFTACAQNKDQKQVAASPDSIPVYNIPGPTPLSDAEKQRIFYSSQAFFDTLLGKSPFNGGMLVAKGGNIVFEKYKGSLNLDGKEPVTDSTSMHVASVSKTFTAMAILKLQEQGKLSIEDPLTKYFPDFNYPGITIRLLMEHRSGLPKYEYFMEDAGWNKDSIITNRDVLQWLIYKKDEIKNIGTPDRSFVYCNTNYALLALIMEKVTGEKFPAYMQRTIFTPLGLNHTFVHYTGDNRVVAKSFEYNNREVADNFLDGVYGDKNVYTTPRDLLRWDRALSDTTFLSAKSLQSSYQPYSNEKPGVKNYGFGWHMNIYPNGKKMIFHNGWWHGSNASFIRLIDEDATIIVIGNRRTNAVYKAKYLVNTFAPYFDGPMIDDGENAAPAEKKVVATKASRQKAKVIARKPVKKAVIRKKK